MFCTIAPTDFFSNKKIPVLFSSKSGCIPSAVWSIIEQPELLYNNREEFVKLQVLKNIISSLRSVLVAYSGGVDSTLLLNIAHEVLAERVVAVTVASPLYPARETQQAKELAARFGVRHILIEYDPLANSKVVENSPQRCYWCKKELFQRLAEMARQQGCACVVDGANHDDLQDFRPGTQAAQECGVRSPLQEAGLTKEEIRALSRALGLPTWDKPSLACIASRFPYGMRITREALGRVAAAEELLQDSGFRQLRVRHHGETARIEVPQAEMMRLLEEKVRSNIIAGFKKLGYTYVTLDLEGYRSGSMNEVLPDIRDAAEELKKNSRS